MTRPETPATGTSDLWWTAGIGRSHKVDQAGLSRCGQHGAAPAKWREPTHLSVECKRCAAWEERELTEVDGRMVAAYLHVEAHGVNGYVHHQCRCEPCTDGWVAAQRRRGDAHRAARVEINGQMIAVNADTHNASTYRNRSCRCDTCCTANSRSLKLRRSQGRRSA